MTTHMTVSRDKWLEARRDLLTAEKDLTRRSDKVAQLRRQLPWVNVDKEYVFEGPDGRQTLADLVDGRDQLMVQHVMLTPGAEQSCPSCSYMADHTDGMIAHRDVTFVAILRAAFTEIERFRQRMGWRFKWLSTHGNSFNYDLRVSFTLEEVARGELPNNYGTWPHAFEEWPGISVFWKGEAGDVFHTYSTYGRGVEVMMGTYRLLDLTPKGRDERDTFSKMEWVRHHDSYAPKLPAMDKPADASCCKERA
jgi:predicted dithiol-disulfide oxidoreductase (DUF899 family)